MGRDTSATLVGRDEELRRFSADLDDPDEPGRGLLLAGDAGIGKTALLAAFADLARARGHLVLGAAGVETETRLPYAALADVLGPLLDERGPAGAEPACGLAPHLRAALHVALGHREGAVPAPFLVALAALSLLTAAAALHPVVVALDDVQWLDRPSHEALAFVARRLRADPVVLVATMRRATGAHREPLVPLQEACEEVEVPALDEVSSRRVLDTTGPDLVVPDRVRVLREARGNPLALVELPRALATEALGHASAPGVLPTTARLERAFAGRVDALPRLTRDVLLTAAVGSVEDLAEILAAAEVLVGLPPGLGALDDGARAGLVVVDLTRLRFRHPLVRSALVSAAAPSRVREAHAAWAAVLDAEPLRRVWHRAYSLLGPDDAVAAELEDGHRASLARGDVGSAIWALERAARLSSDPAARGHRLLLAAELAFGLADAGGVERLVGEAERLPLSELDRIRVPWLRELFSGGTPGDAGRVVELCTAARRAAAVGEQGLASDLLLGAALRCWWADAGPQAGATVVSGVRDVGRDADPRHVAALGCAAPVACGTEVIRRLADVGIERIRDADVLRGYGMAAHAVGDEVRAADFLDRAETRLRDQGRLTLLQQVLAMQIHVRLELGDWRRAREAAAEANRLSAETGQDIWDGGGLMGQARLAALGGDHARALELADEVEQAVEHRRLNDILACVQVVRGFAYLVAERPADAFAALRRLFDPDDACFHQRERFDGLLPLAEAAVASGYLDAARSIVDELSDVADTTTSPLLRMQLLTARVLLGDPEAVLAEHPVAEAELGRWPWPRARIELARGQWLRRHRRGVEARELLRSARITLELIGAEPWAEVARQELRAGGEQVGGPQPGEHAEDLLSAQEMQIARLAAAGLTNREVGARLYLSPRTVSSHLYRIFPKLGVTSRAQLVHRLQEHHAQSSD